MKKQMRKVRRWIPVRWEDVDTKGPAVGETLLISRLLYPGVNTGEPSEGETFSLDNGATVKVESYHFNKGDPVSQWVMLCKVVA